MALVLIEKNILRNALDEQLTTNRATAWLAMVVALEPALTVPKVSSAARTD
jgi:hypothetical protein